MKGFEPPAPCSQSTCATRLRYTPKVSDATLAATRFIIHKEMLFVNGFFEKFFTFFLPVVFLQKKGLFRKSVYIFDAEPLSFLPENIYNINNRSVYRSYKEENDAFFFIADGLHPALWLRELLCTGGKYHDLHGSQSAARP